MGAGGGGPLRNLTLLGGGGVKSVDCVQNDQNDQSDQFHQIMGVSLPPGKLSPGKSVGASPGEPFLRDKFWGAGLRQPATR